MGAVTKDLRAKLERSEERVTRWLVHRSIAILRIGLGCVFLGFGLLKFFPGLSPAEALVKQTLDVLTLGVVPASVGIVLVAITECLIGIGLITDRFPRLTLALLGFQMLGAMSPLLLFPGELFGGPFRAPTLEGQYVIKDVVLIAAGLVVGATLRGARLVSEHVRRSEDYTRYSASSTGDRPPSRRPRG